MRVHAFHRLYQYRQSISTKPFNARGCHVKRCRYCQVAESLCLCDGQPDINSEVACLLLVSENEVFKPSNTGRLIADTIKETYVYQWNRTAPDAEMLRLLENEVYQPIVVFPADEVSQPSRVFKVLPSLAETPATSDKRKWLFIFIDGSWREARKIFRRSPFLESLPVLSISPENLSAYMMRRSNNDQHLATAEVATLVLKQAGEELASLCLQGWFEAFRESYLLTKSRGKGESQRPALQRYLARFKSESSL